MRCKQLLPSLSLFSLWLFEVIVQFDVNISVIYMYVQLVIHIYKDLPFCVICFNKKLQNCY